MKVSGMLVGKFKLNPKARQMSVWLKLKLTPKGDFCLVSIRAFFVIFFFFCTVLNDTWVGKYSDFPSQTPKARR